MNEKVFNTPQSYDQILQISGIFYKASSNLITHNIKQL